MNSENFLQNFLDNAPFSIVIVSIKDSKLIYYNNRAKEKLGFSSGEGIGLEIIDFYYDKNQREMVLEKMKKYGSINDFELCFKDYKGSPFWALFSASVLSYKGEDAYIITINDVTKRKMVLEELKISEEKYRLLAENTGDVIWVMNMNTMKYIYISPSIEQLRGYTVEEAMAQTFEESMTAESAKYLMEIEEATKSMEKFLADPANPVIQIHEIRQPCKNGEIIWVETSTKFRLNDKNEIETVGTSRNIENRKKIEKEILYLSYRDQLTGLYNRRFIEEEIKRLDRLDTLPLSVIVGDVDKLKWVNDFLGHEKGDELLMKTANAIKSACRNEDLVSRWGGDEFVVILPKTNPQEAKKIAAQINSNCKAENIDGNIISISIGIGTKISENESINEIIRQADDAMYEIKALKKKSK